MSSRGFLLLAHDDDSFDQPDIRALSPSIVISRSDFFQGGEAKGCTSSIRLQIIISDVINEQNNYETFYLCFDFCSEV